MGRDGQQDNTLEKNLRDCGTGSGERAIVQDDWGRHTTHDPAEGTKGPVSMPTKEGVTLFDDIVSLNGQAARNGQFEVAYHLLAAALHAAQDAGDVVGIEQIIALAEQQESAVDAIDPSHSMSSERAHQRGNPSLYQSLISTANAKRAQLDAEQVIQEHKDDRALAAEKQGKR
jgi:hypothetical protein